MPDLFISYSRRDQEFVRRLHGALKDRGKDAWVDWEDIPPTAKWRDEIRAAVAASDAFGFVLTPDSLKSEICGEELDMALEQNKRIVPMLRRPPDGVPVPDELSAHNWIFFSDDEQFAQGLQTLVEALETDVERTHLHTRLLVRADEWDARGRENSRLLRGSDLREAEAFLDQVDVAPEPTGLQREYVAASRRHAGRRLRMLLAGVSVALVVSIVLGILALIQRNLAQQRERQAVSRSLAALAVTQLGVDPERGVLLAMEALKRNVTPEADLALRRAVGADQLRATLRSGGVVHGVDFSKDGRLVVTASDDHYARIWNASTGALLHQLRHIDAVNSAQFTPDGKEVITASVDGTARAWQTATGQPVGPYLAASGALVRAVPLSGSLVAAAGADGAVRVWDDRTAKPIATLGSPKGPKLTDLAGSPDGRLVVAGDKRGGVRLWNPGTQRAITLRPPTVIKAAINRVAFSPNGQVVAAGSDDGTATLWNTHGKALAKLTGDPSNTLLGFKFVDGIEDLAFSPDGHYVATSGLVRGDTRVWSVPDGQPVVEFPGNASVYAVRFSPDSRLVVTAGVDSQTRVWSVDTGQQVAAFAGHTAKVNAVAFSPDGSRIATASDDGTARLWETYPGRSLGQLAGGQSLVAAVPLPNGSDVLIAGGNTAALVNPNTGNPTIQVNQPQTVVDAIVSSDSRNALIVTASSLRLVDAATLGKRHSLTLQSPPGKGIAYVLGPAISRDGRRIICGLSDGTAGIWDGTTGRLVSVLRPTGHADPTELTSPVVGTDISPDGSRAVTAQGTHARVWDTRTGSQLAVIAPGAPLSSAVLSPDGKLVATAGTNPEQATGPGVWSALNGQRVFGLHDNFGVFNAAFSHDGRHVVTAGIAGTTTIWDLSSGRGLRVQGGPAGAADHAAFSPDDREIAVAGADDTTRIFDARSGVALATLAGGQLPIDAAYFGSTHSPLSTVDNGGNLSFYACDVCGSTKDVLAAAKSLITRSLTPAERRTYVP